MSNYNDYMRSLIQSNNAIIEASKSTLTSPLMEQQQEQQKIKVTDNVVNIDDNLKSELATYLTSEIVSRLIDYLDMIDPVLNFSKYQSIFDRFKSQPVPFAKLAEIVVNALKTNTSSSQFSDLMKDAKKFASDLYNEYNARNSNNYDYETNSQDTGNSYYDPNYSNYPRDYYWDSNMPQDPDFWSKYWNNHNNAYFYPTTTSATTKKPSSNSTTTMTSVGKSKNQSPTTPFMPYADYQLPNYQLPNFQLPNFPKSIKKPESPEKRTLRLITGEPVEPVGDKFTQEEIDDMNRRKSRMEMVKNNQPSNDSLYRINELGDIFLDQGNEQNINKLLIAFKNANASRKPYKDYSLKDKPTLENVKTIINNYAINHNLKINFAKKETLVEDIKNFLTNQNIDLYDRASLLYDLETSNVFFRDNIDKIINEQQNAMQRVEGKGLKKIGKKHYVNKRKLDKDNLLEIRYIKNNHLTHIKPTKVSHNVKNIINDVLTGKNDVKDYLRQLNNKEKSLIGKVNKVVGMGLMMDDDEGYNNDFNILMGQIRSGNNNKEIQDKLREHIFYFYDIGKITKIKAYKLLHELKLL